MNDNDNDEMNCDYPDAVAKRRKQMAEGKLCSACGAKMTMSETLAYAADGTLVSLPKDAK
jgi:hypothetical protein